MGKRFSVAKLITAPAGASGEEVIYVVEAAKRFRINSVRIDWASGSDFNLHVRICIGLLQIAPGEGFYAAASGHTEDRVEAVAESGERIIAHYMNFGTSDLKFHVIIRGILE